jgi:hypothetical protein
MLLLSSKGKAWSHSSLPPYLSGVKVPNLYIIKLECHRFYSRCKVRCGAKGIKAIKERSKARKNLYFKTGCSLKLKKPIFLALGIVPN